MTCQETDDRLDEWVDDTLRGGMSFSATRVYIE